MEWLMTISVVSSREFSRDIGRAKQAAVDGPVFITEGDRPSHVLLSFEEYQRITDSRNSIVDLLSMPADDDIDFESPRLEGEFYRPADLS